MSYDPKTAGIGSPLFAANRPEILRPMSSIYGRLQVIPRLEEDTHVLVVGDKELARHPNGFACHELAERMVKGDLTRIMAQADYLVDCGGKVSPELRKLLETSGKTIHDLPICPACGGFHQESQCYLVRMAHLPK